MSAHFIFDAHLDLALNAIEWNRDLRQPLDAVRGAESHLTDKPGRGCATVTLDEMRRAGVGICVATLLARLEHNMWSPVFGWKSQQQAWAMTQGQLAWYRAMDEAGEMVQIRDLGALESHLACWQTADKTERLTLPVGWILSLEGADSIFTPAHLERAWADGLRAVGPAHYGPGVYAMGTEAAGGLPESGRELLREMDRLGMILDVTHFTDECFWEALEVFHGTVWASHHNARALTPHQRQLSDEMFLALAARGGVSGLALDAWMMVPGWVRGKTTPQSAGLQLSKLVEHADHFCQLTGNTAHVGIGTDLDGCFGYEQTPEDFQRMTALQRLPGLFAARGYSETDIDAILHGNFLRCLRSAWSDECSAND